MLNVDMHKVVEPGVFEIMVGPNSQQTSTVTLEVLASGEKIGAGSASQNSDAGLVSNLETQENLNLQLIRWRSSRPVPSVPGIPT